MLSSEEQPAQTRDKDREDEDGIGWELLFLVQPLERGHLSKPVMMYREKNPL